MGGGTSLAMRAPTVIGPGVDCEHRDVVARALRGRVDDALARFLEAAAPQFASPSSLSSVYDVLCQFVLGGGKRMRPLFCYWGWRSAGGEDCEEIIRAAASLELFHAFALMHDDIMDRSALRRGEPAMHHTLTDLHDRNGWRGERDHCGTSLAILCGDLCLTYSDELLHECGLALGRLWAAQKLVHKMRSEMVIGQSLDLLDQASGGSLDGALTIVALKAGRYTVERPLQIGATLAGAEDDLLAAYSAFAVPLGEAFQLRDDVLGVFGDARVTGKPAIDDLRDGKPTVLIALAREAATPLQIDVLDEWYGNRLLDEDRAAGLRAAIAATGAPGCVERMIRARHLAALTALEELPIPRATKDALSDLAAAATTRTS
jgi:geranylgeranyl diphosphate synthase type I